MDKALDMLVACLKVRLAKQGSSAAVDLIQTINLCDLPPVVCVMWAGISSHSLSNRLCCHGCVSLYGVNTCHSQALTCMCLIESSIALTSENDVFSVL